MKKTFTFTIAVPSLRTVLTVLFSVAAGIDIGVLLMQHTGRCF
jgi:hypothetical protein